LISHPYLFCQYNCISLGLTVAAVAAVLSEKELLACFLFCLGLNHKQVLLIQISLHHDQLLIMTTSCLFCQFCISNLHIKSRGEGLLLFFVASDGHNFENGMLKKKSIFVGCPHVPLLLFVLCLCALAIPRKCLECWVEQRGFIFYIV
jgi:hypothetical protein